MNTIYCCSLCSKQYGTDQIIWKCNCGGLLDLKFTPVFKLKEIVSRPNSMWKYREAIPIEKDSDIVSFNEGFTSIIKLNFGKKSALIKQDHLFPTCSYKDRGASVLISKAKELKIKHLVEDSSGNAGCSIAAYSAKAKIKCDIYVPFSATEGKLFQIKSYGANLHKIVGTREDTTLAAYRAAEKYFYASHVWNPYFFHGTKTFAYETVEQLGWKCPDSVVLPTGNGTILLGSFIGFKELKEAGIIKKIPKIIAVQTKNCSPIFNEFKGIKTQKQFSYHTIAEGIAIVSPARLKQIIMVIKETNGDILTVTEEEISSTHKEMFKSGFCIEPTSASIIAGLKKYLKSLKKQEITISLFTGHGLKTANK